MNLKQLLLGKDAGQGEPLFKSVSELATSVSKAETPNNPYVGRERACAKHLAALFRGDPRARLGDPLYQALRETLRIKLFVQFNDGVDQPYSWHLATFDQLAFELQRGSQIRRPYGDTLEFVASAMSASKRADIFWYVSDPPLPLARHLCARLKQGPFQICIWGCGSIWPSLILAAQQIGLSKRDSIHLLLRARATGKLKVQLFMNDLKTQVVYQIPLLLLDRNKLECRAFLMFPELHNDSYVYEVPPKMRDELRMRFSRIPIQDSVHPSSQDEDEDWDLWEEVEAEVKRELEEKRANR